MHGDTELPGGIAIAVDPGRAAALVDRRADVLPPERPAAAGAEGVGHRVRDRDGRHHLAGLVAGQGDELDGKHPLDLRDHRGEQLLRRGPLRGQRRDAPQRRLLVGQPGETGAALDVRDGRGDQLGEVGEPVLGPLGQRLTIGRGGNHRAPDVAVDEDRGAGRRAHPALAGRGGDRAGGLRVVIDPHRAPGLQDPGDRRAVERPAGAGLERMRKLAPGAEDGRRHTLGVVAPHRDHRQAGHMADLACDRREQVGRCRPAGHERRDAPLSSEHRLVFADLQAGQIGQGIRHARTPTIESRPRPERRTRRVARG